MRRRLWSWPIWQNWCQETNVKWAKAYKDWRIKQWNKVFWTDKSKFENFRSNRRVSVRRRFSERAAAPYFPKTVKHGGGCLMVCVCRGVFFQLQKSGICTRWRANWIRPAITTYWSNTRYHLEQFVGQGFVLMLDKDPKHTYKFCLRYIKCKEEQHFLQLMSWPVQSADLNPIDLVRNELDRKVRAKQPIGAAHVWQLRQGRWAELSSVFRGKNAENLRSSDSGQRWSFWWIKSSISFCVLFCLICIWCSLYFVK